MENCQVCKAELKEDTEESRKALEGDVGNLSFVPAKWMGLCSFKCADKAIRFNAIWNFKELLKNLDNRIPTYAAFRDLFGFDEAGGYCEDKYKRMKLNGFMFVCSLDKDQFMKLLGAKK